MPILSPERLLQAPASSVDLGNVSETVKIHRACYKLGGCLNHGIPSMIAWKDPCREDISAKRIITARSRSKQ